ncbi:12986_t:CDS:1 [Racocetra fulgida]|uniref:12986_t:CDS:1 n=1 Tax=Racocetra fulgida TaxID=60492 RepID=A0A9N9A3Q9_9GLOM|nr:12986_t:CDS:1 [Racocetra fulgida]
MTFHRAEKQRFKPFSIFNKKAIAPADVTMPQKISYLSLLQGTQFFPTTKPIIFAKDSAEKVNVKVYESNESPRQHQKKQFPTKIFQKALKKITKVFKPIKLETESNTIPPCSCQVKTRVKTEVKPNHRRFGIYVSPECGNKFVPTRFELSKNRQRACMDDNENPYLPTPKPLPGTIHKFPISELKLLKFQINYYWESLSVSHNMVVPDGITFNSFMRYCQQEVEFKIPNDCIVLAHTKNFEDKDRNSVVIEKEGTEEKIDYKRKAIELKNLFERDSLKIIDCEDMWKISMKEWNNRQDNKQDNVIEVTLFSAEML